MIKKKNLLKAKVTLAIVIKMTKRPESIEYV